MKFMNHCLVRASGSSLPARLFWTDWAPIREAAFCKYNRSCLRGVRVNVLQPPSAVPRQRGHSFAIKLAWPSDVRHPQPLPFLAGRRLVEVLYQARINRWFASFYHMRLLCIPIKLRSQCPRQILLHWREACLCLRSRDLQVISACKSAYADSSRVGSVTRGCSCTCKTSLCG